MVATSTNALLEDSHRAFRGTPDLLHYVPLESVQREVRRLLDAIVRGDGIVVLTAAPGAGKTVVCRHLQSELSRQFEAVLLSSSEFATRRSLLQAILFELGGAYEGFSEQELRLAILSHVRQNLSERRGLVLIVDEAHLLNPRLLEELRCLTNHAAGGESLIRIALCAQLALEELLTQPALQALNYRITCHATIEPLSMRESAELVAGRLRQAGCQLEAVFTPETLETICRVSDGNPRCLIQLCDHTLTLADTVNEGPVSVEVARRALQELKQLPLQWNESTIDQWTEQDRRSDAESDRFGLPDVEPATLPTPPAWESNVDLPSNDELDDEWDAGEMPEWTSSVTSVEVGGVDDMPAWEPESSADRWSTFETEPEQSPASAQSCVTVTEIDRTNTEPTDKPVSSTTAESPASASDAFVEIPVDDRYAALDEQAGGHSMELPQTIEAPAAHIRKPVDSDMTTEPTPEPISIGIPNDTNPLDDNKPVDSCHLGELGDIFAGQAEQEVPEPVGGFASEDWASIPAAGFDVVEPQWHEEPVLDDVPTTALPPVIETADATNSEVGTTGPPQRPYARLFSRLRRERV